MRQAAAARAARCKHPTLPCSQGRSCCPCGSPRQRRPAARPQVVTHWPALKPPPPPEARAPAREAAAVAARAHGRGAPLPPALAAEVAAGALARLHAAALRAPRALLAAAPPGGPLEWEEQQQPLAVAVSRSVDFGIQRVAGGGGWGGGDAVGSGGGGDAAGGAPPRVLYRSLRVRNAGAGPVHVVSVSAAPPSAFFTLADDHGVCAAPEELARRAAAAVRGGGGEAPACVVLQPGEECEVTVALTLRLTAGAAREDLGLCSQLLLVTLAAPAAAGGDAPAAVGGDAPAPPAAGGGWAWRVVGRRLTALLVGREAAALAGLLRADAPPFVPAHARDLLRALTPSWMFAPRHLALPLAEELVGAGRCCLAAAAVRQGGLAAPGQRTRLARPLTPASRATTCRARRPRAPPARSRAAARARRSPPSPWPPSASPRASASRRPPRRPAPRPRARVRARARAAGSCACTARSFWRRGRRSATSRGSTCLTCPCGRCARQPGRFRRRAA